MSTLELWVFGSLGIAAVALLWNVVRVFLPSRLPQVGEPVCAHCRYPVQGLGDWKCPECGSDFRVVGILTPQLRHRARASLAGGVLSWVVLMLLVGLVTAAFAVPRMVTETRTQSSISQRVITLASRSGEYPSVQIIETTSVTADGWSTPRAAIRFEGVGEYQIGKDGMTADQLLTWLGEQGMDTSRDIVVWEVTELARILAASMNGSGMVSSNVFRSVSMMSNTRASGPVITRVHVDPWLYAIAGIWLTLSIAGVCLLVFWRRRQRRVVFGETGSASPAISPDPSA